MKQFFPKIFDIADGDFRNNVWGKICNISQNYDFTLFNENNG